MKIILHKNGYKVDIWCRLCDFSDMHSLINREVDRDKKIKYVFIIYGFYLCSFALILSICWLLWTE